MTKLIIISVVFPTVRHRWCQNEWANTRVNGDEIEIKPELMVISLFYLFEEEFDQKDRSIDSQSRRYSIVIFIIFPTYMSR